MAGKRAKKKVKVGKVKVMRPTTTLLDRQAMAYAMLLADPCGAPLAHPVYAGGDGGYLFRAESFTTVGTSAGHTAGTVLFTPGAINASGTELLTTSAIAGSSGATAAALDITPGKTFLTDNASNVRCVAACMKVSFPGAESARSGRIHFGQVSGSTYSLGDVFTPDGLAQALPHYTRTPAGEVEIIWKPNSGDQMFTNPARTADVTFQDRDRRAAIAVAFAGLPAAVGVTVRLTCVWEWQPKIGRGMSNPTLSRSTAAATLDQVLNYLAERGFQYVRGVGFAAGEALAAGAVGLFANQAQRLLGAMPAVSVSRTLPRLEL